MTSINNKALNPAEAQQSAPLGDAKAGDAGSSPSMSAMKQDLSGLVMEKKIVRRATIAYVTAVCLIALLTVVGQTLIHITLRIHSEDGTKINVGGRQRMLSQKMSLETLGLIYYAQCNPPNTTFAASIAPTLTTLRRSAINLWTASHTDLQAGSSALGISAEKDAGVLAAYTVLAPRFARLAGNMAAFDTGNKNDPATMSDLIDDILPARQSFLVQMNDIVSTYQTISDGRIYWLIVIEVVLLVFTLFVLILEVFFVVRPALQHMRNIQRIKKASLA
ncbi:hypothetical protein BC831DRAFT_515459 [Entophlyctis helioformis]|nr:hypothetical protein BC831DRAFT_515459 [Entophlyctis helioformis]